MREDLIQGTTAAKSAPIGHPSVDNASLAQALNRIRRLEADINECREYLEDIMDVNDGDYGEPSPNRAMQLVNMIDESINGRPY